MRAALRLMLVLAGAFMLIGCTSSKARVVPLDLIDVDSELQQKDGLSSSAKLQYVQMKTWAYLEVIERSPNVKSVSRVTNNEKPDVYFNSLDHSPTEDALAYSVTEKAEEVYKVEGKKSNLLSEIYASNIWFQKVGSFAKSRLTVGKRVDIHPSFTRDGKKILFSSDRSGRQKKIWMLNVEGGGGLRMITSSPAEDFSPSASRAGDVLAFTSLPEGVSEAQVWTIDMQGRIPTQLREGMDARISHDGRHVVFLVKENENYCDEKNKTAGKNVYQIWKMNIEGDSETQLTFNEEYCVRDVSWSPDGKWLAFSSNENADLSGMRNYDIWVMAADGTRRMQLTTNGSMDIMPVFDRTGEHIYFISNRGGKWNIWRFKPVLD